MYCQNCIPEYIKLDKKDKKDYYCQNIVRYNFKAEIYFYNMLKSFNKKIS